MTKEELVNEAEEYVKQNYCEMCVMADDCKCGCIDCFTVQAYLAGVEPREKRIAELEAQIEKMKLCQNCKYESKDYMEIPCRNCIRCLGDIKRKGNSDKWEIKEK